MTGRPRPAAQSRKWKNYSASVPRREIELRDVSLARELRTSPSARRRERKRRKGRARKGRRQDGGRKRERVVRAKSYDAARNRKFDSRRGSARMPTYG